MNRYELKLWLIAAVFWLIALYAWWQGVAISQPGMAPSKGTDYGYWAMLVYIIAALAVWHNHQKWIAAMPAARFEKSGSLYTVTPVTKHYPFAFAALVGGVLIMALPNSYYGNGFATLAAYIFIALLLVMLVHPYFLVRRRITRFELSGETLKTGNYALPLNAITYSVSNRMKKRKEGVILSYGNDNFDTTLFQRPQTMGQYAMGAAQQTGLDTHAAVSNALANMINNYFSEMKAKSFRVTAKSGGKSVIIADGLDEASAVTLAEELRQSRSV